MQSIYFKLGPLEFALDHAAAQDVTAIIFFTMIAAAVLAGLVLLH